MKNILLAALGVSALWLALAACGNDPAPATVTPEVTTPEVTPSEVKTTEVTSARGPNAAVTGTVTYRERLALSPDAKLVMELRDVSYADADAPLIARQTISSPGQVPIIFRLEYNRDDIDPRNTYGISARIIEADGRLAFINDTAYDVITGGNPSRVDMLLVLVQPPPDLVQEGVDWRQWIEVPARVISANLIPNEQEHFLRIEFYQSTVEGCARRGNQALRVEETRIIATLTLMQPPPTAWAIECDAELVELDAVEPINESLEPGQTYQIVVNDVLTSTFSLPRPSLGHTFIAESPIERAEVLVLESAPPQYQVHVVSGHPRGSGCSQSNGYEIRRMDSNRIDVVVTHHQVSDPQTICTADFPIVETNIPLGSGFEPGQEYIVRVNSDTKVTFEAQ